MKILSLNKLFKFYLQNHIGDVIKSRRCSSSPSSSSSSSTTTSIIAPFKENEAQHHHHRQQQRQNENKSSGHKPVMVKEVLDSLQPHSNGIYIDMTFGGGGHTKEILKLSPNSKMIVIDRDPDAYACAMELSKQYGENQLIPILGKFSEIPEQLHTFGIEYESIDGILFDFGCSSMQFDRGERGFSINHNGPLDMRMDGNRCADQPTVADILAKIDEFNLARILKVYGEEKQAKKIARAIIDTRYSFKKIETTHELAEIIRSCFPEQYSRVDKLHRYAHVATKTFQALRIFANNELNEINYGMILANRLLKPNTGKLITITFHSLEDTIVKRHLCGNIIGNLANPLPLKYASAGLVQDFHFINTIMKSNWQSMYKHVIVPQSKEIEQNPRSRSAKLRAAIKLL